MLGFRKYDKPKLARRETQMVGELFAAGDSDRAHYLETKK